MLIGTDLPMPGRFSARNFLTQVRRVHEENRRVYGVLKVGASSTAKATRVAMRTVERLMAADGLHCVISVASTRTCADAAGHDPRTWSNEGSVLNGVTRSEPSRHPGRQHHDAIAAAREKLSTVRAVV